MQEQSMSSKWLGVSVLTMLAVVLAPPAFALEAAMTDGQYYFLVHSRCGSCHGENSGVPRAQSLDAMSAFSPERVYTALTTGNMSIHVEGLNDEQKRRVAMNLTGRPFGDAAARAAAAMPNRCAGAEPVGPASGLRGWPSANADPTNSGRFQSASEAGLAAEQIPRLSLKWSFGLPDSGGMRAQPVVTGGRVYLGSDNGNVYALDARSGCVYWSFHVGNPVVTAVSAGAMPQSKRRALYFGDWLAYVYALDAQTGEFLWKVRVDDHPAAKITGSPVLKPGGERLYVPVGSYEEGIAWNNPEYECCTSQGSVVALDTAGGKQIWKSYTIPERPRPVHRNSRGVQRFGPAGAGVWSAPTLDLARNAVYVGTANGYIDVPDHGSSDAVIAFDLDTGERLWSTQLLAGDHNCEQMFMPEEVARVDCPGYRQAPNDDVSGSPILVTTPGGGQILIAGQESSRITALDPDRNGEVLWVAQASDSMDGPAGMGMGPAADGSLYYRPVALPDGTGGMAALRTETGERAWYTTHPKPVNCPDPDAVTCSSGLSGAATVIPGAVFAGGRDGMLRAYSTNTGRVLWEYNTMRQFETGNEVSAKGGSIAAQGPAISGGMLFIGSGYAILESVPGNVLLAFGVD